jgi:hypothetical protein
VWAGAFSASAHILSVFLPKSFVNPKNRRTFAGDFAQKIGYNGRNRRPRRMKFGAGSWTYENNHYFCTPNGGITLTPM